MTTRFVQGFIQFRPQRRTYEIKIIKLCLEKKTLITPQFGS